MYFFWPEATLLCEEYKLTLLKTFTKHCIPLTNFKIFTYSVQFKLIYADVGGWAMRMLECEMLKYFFPGPIEPFKWDELVMLIWLESKHYLNFKYVKKKIWTYQPILIFYKSQEKPQFKMFMVHHVFISQKLKKLKEGKSAVRPSWCCLLSIKQWHLLLQPPLDKYILLFRWSLKK